MPKMITSTPAAMDPAPRDQAGINVATVGKPSLHPVTSPPVLRVLYQAIATRLQAILRSHAAIRAASGSRSCLFNKKSQRPGATALGCLEVRQWITLPSKENQASIRSG